MIRETKELSFKLTEVTDAGQFSGYGSTWEGPPDGYNDVVQRGAFKKSLSEHRSFPLLWSHQPTEPLGVIGAREDEKGLFVDGSLNLDVARAREIRSLMAQMKAAGIPMGLSIGYEAIQAERDREGVRRLKEIKLYEISPVIFPACDTARIADVKAADEKAKTLRLIDSIRL